MSAAGTPGRRPRLAYYAHHHGTGHLRHAQNIASLDVVDLLVTSTGERDPALLPGPAGYVALEPDVGAGGEPLPQEPVRGFHYLPTGPLIRKRFARLAAAWDAFGAEAVLVDVSVEVAVFARLAGYPVIFRRMPGRRVDDAHRLAYDAASRLVAYYPSDLEDPEHLSAHGARSTYLGMLAPAPLRGPAGRAGGRRLVVVQTSLGGSLGLGGIARAAAATPGWDWMVAGNVESPVGVAAPPNLRLLGVVPDPARLMGSADVVVTSAGHNAIAAAAFARRPAVVIPEDRPFGEQAAFAERLRGLDGVVVARDWDAVPDWGSTLGAAAAGVPDGLAQALLVDRAEFRAGFERMVGRVVGGCPGPQ
ncbi:glycosyltransferase [Arthrobacter halodurans]|uniref:Glycosyltransferase n=1 Tax=Arthrobacter halodurans TaxID=516699 RepID=A0ABV4UNT4_9MICC